METEASHESSESSSQPTKPSDDHSNVETEHKSGSVEFLSRIPAHALLLICGAISYAICTGFLVTFVKGDVSLKEELLRQVSPRTWEWTVVAFYTALLMNTLTLVFGFDSAKTGPTLIACYINILAASAYIINGRGMGPMLIDTWGNVMEPVRDMMWLHTTPMMIYNLSLVSDDKPRTVAINMGADILMVIFGTISRTLPYKPIAGAFMGLALICFVYILLQMWRMFDAPIQCNTKHSAAMSLHSIRCYNMVLWPMFPVIAALEFNNLISGPTSMQCFAILDVLGKVIYSSGLVMSNFISMDHRKLMAMRAVEDANKLQVIAELQQVIEQKNHFLSSTSHELRTPLNGIIGLSEAMLVGSCGELSERAVRTLGTIKQSGSRLLTLINDILDAASMQKGKLVVKHEKVNLRALVDDVVELCNPLVKKGVRLVNMISSDIPEIRGDTARIIQILYNLVGNSVKFTHKGSITIGAGLAGNYVEVWVADTGIGIPEHKFSTIFNSFEQVDMGTTRKYGGTGLGLALVKQLVEAHEGQIRVDSELNHGTRFIFTLLVHETSSDQIDATQENSSDAAKTVDAKREIEDANTEPKIIVNTYTPPPASAMKGKAGNNAHKSRGCSRKATGHVSVLSVDDDPINQLVIKNLLSSTGYKLDQAMDGQEALDFLETCHHFPDIILLDIMMPGMSGIEVCKEVRIKYPNVAITIIMVSAKGKEEHFVEGLGAGANDYVVKPFNRQELLARITAHLSFQDVVVRGWSHSSMDLSPRASGPVPRFSTSSAVRRSTTGVRPDVVIASSNRSTICTGASSLLDLLLAAANNPLSSDMVFQVEMPKMVIIQAAIMNMGSLVSQEHVTDMLLSLTHFYQIVDELVVAHNVYYMEPLDGGNMMFAAEVSDHGNQDGLANALNFAAALVGRISQLNSKMHHRLELCIGMHCGRAAAVLVNHERPVLHFVGPAVLKSVALTATCPPMCVHISQAITQEATGTSYKYTPATAETWLLEVGLWAEGIEKLSGRWREYMKHGQRSHYDFSHKAARPLTVACCLVAAAAPAGLWEALSKSGQPVSNRIKELEDVKKTNCLLEEQLATVSEEADLLQDKIAELETQLKEAKEVSKGAARCLLAGAEPDASMAYAVLHRETEQASEVREEHLQDIIHKLTQECEQLRMENLKAEHNLQQRINYEVEELTATGKTMKKLESANQTLEMELDQLRSLVSGDGMTRTIGSTMTSTQKSGVILGGSTFTTWKGLPEIQSYADDDTKDGAISAVHAGQGLTCLGSTGKFLTVQLRQIGAVLPIRMLLEDAGLENLANTFEQEEITIDMLPRMDDITLRCLGVRTIGQRMQLMSAVQRAIESLHEESPRAESTTTTLRYVA